MLHKATADRELGKLLRVGTTTPEHPQWHGEQP